MNWIDYRSVKPLSYSREVIGCFPEKSKFVLPLWLSAQMEKMAISITANPYLKSEQESFIEASRSIASLIPDDILNSICDGLNNGYGAVLIEGLPTDKYLPDTPLVGGSLTPDYKTTFVAEAMLIMLGILTGAEPFNFRQEGWGKAPLIDNIVPVEKLRVQKGAGGFENNFPFHCESAWHRKRPDYLVLLGVREDVGAQTLIFSVEMLNDHELTRQSSEIESWFRLRSPDLYLQMEQAGIPMGTANYSFEPPIKYENGKIMLNINFNGTDCIHETAVEWLSKLEDFVELNSQGVVICPGNAIILNNYKTCHTRTGYKPGFNGSDRWFLRGYFKNDLWDIKDYPKINNEELSQLIKLGWITEKYELTDAFLKYVYFPDEIKSLDDNLIDLINIAFKYTPIIGNRII